MGQKVMVTERHHHNAKLHLWRRTNSKQLFDFEGVGWIRAKMFDQYRFHPEDVQKIFYNKCIVVIGDSGKVGVFLLV